MEERWKGQLAFFTILCEFALEETIRWDFETTYDGITYYLVDNEFYFAEMHYNNI